MATKQYDPGSPKRRANRRKTDGGGSGYRSDSGLGEGTSRMWERRAGRKPVAGGSLAYLDQLIKEAQNGR